MSDEIGGNCVISGGLVDVGWWKGSQVDGQRKAGDEQVCS